MAKSVQASISTSVNRCTQAGQKKSLCAWFWWAQKLGALCYLKNCILTKKNPVCLTEQPKHKKPKGICQYKIAIQQDPNKQHSQCNKPTDGWKIGRHYGCVTKFRAVTKFLLWANDWEQCKPLAIRQHGLQPWLCMLYLMPTRSARVWSPWQNLQRKPWRQVKPVATHLQGLQFWPWMFQICPAATSESIPADMTQIWNCFKQWFSLDCSKTLWIHAM